MKLCDKVFFVLASLLFFFNCLRAQIPEPISQDTLRRDSVNHETPSSVPA
jgi:hypothetical protein